MVVQQVAPRGSADLLGMSRLLTVRLAEVAESQSTGPALVRVARSGHRRPAQEQGAEAAGVTRLGSTKGCGGAESGSRS